MSLMRGVLMAFVVTAATQAAAQTSSSSPSSSSSQAQQPPASRAQTPPKTQTQSASDLPVSLGRIRDGVMRSSRIELPDFGVPTFRVAVEQDTIKLPDLYGGNNAVGDYVRGAYFSNAHQEFLDMSSPSGRPVVMGGGIPVLSLISGLKKSFRERERSRVRQQIQEELREIDPENTAGAIQISSPSRPPQ